MVRRVLALRVLPVVAGLALVAVALSRIAPAPSALAGSERLPDLDQELPSDLVITATHATNGRRVYVLGFRSAVRNIGDGPLIFEATRPGPETATMTADQVIERDGAPREVVRDVGRVRYVISPDHRHWHLLGFDHYALRRAGRRSAVVRDRKTGFCLGDRYAVRGPPLPSASPDPVYTSRCGLAEPELLAIEEGISVGYGDDYTANLEGQYLPLTGLRGGRYVLVHTVNANRGLRELDYSNDSASLLLELRWHGRSPLVRVLRTCPGSARCDARRSHGPKRSRPAIG